MLPFFFLAAATHQTNPPQGGWNQSTMHVTCSAKSDPKPFRPTLTPHGHGRGQDSTNLAAFRSGPPRGIPRVIWRMCFLDACLFFVLVLGGGVKVKIEETFLDLPGEIWGAYFPNGLPATTTYGSVNFHVGPVLLWFCLCEKTLVISGKFHLPRVWYFFSCI